MDTNDERINRLDIGLFEKIYAQLTPADKKSLLAIQKAVRSRVPAYTYLEIGSHLGGSIQPYLLDDRCKGIISIDKRPIAQADARGEKFHYEGNSSQRMMDLVTEVSREASGKVRCIDADASTVDPTIITPGPTVCLIDGEHTDTAVESDFRFCWTVVSRPGVIVFHDANVVYTGLQTVLEILRAESVTVTAYVLPSTVFVIECGSFDLHQDLDIQELLRHNAEPYLYALQSMHHYREVYTSWPVRVLRTISHILRHPQTLFRR